MLRVLTFAVPGVSLFMAGVAQGSPFATQVVDYVPGDIATDYRNASAALGKTNEFNPGEPAFDIPPTVVTPFNATFAPDDLVGIGEGGRLVLELGRMAATGAGATLGVHAGVGLIDADWPNGTISGPATTYTSPREADVRVSFDGDNWLDLGQDVLFDLPTNWWADGITEPGAADESGTVQAEFTQPFLGRLSDFDDSTWEQVLGTLEGSAGGTWFDLSDVDLPGVNFVEFSVPDAGEAMFVDAVVAIPEPAMLAPMAMGLLALRRRGQR